MPNSRLFFLTAYFQAEVISKATASVPSPIKNLTDVNRTVNIQQLLSAIGWVQSYGKYMSYQITHL